MVRMNVNEAARDFESVIDRVVRDGEGVELERDHCVVARIFPSNGDKARTADEWNAMFLSLPRLGEDAEAFARDIEQARQSQSPVRDPWVD